MSSGDRGTSSSSCTSVNTVCSDGGRLSSSASSASLQDASHSSSSSSSSSSSLPYGAVPTYDASSSSSSSLPKRNGSDISLDLTPLVSPHGVGGGGAAHATGQRHASLDDSMAATMASSPRQLSRLERVALEIVETEQTYVRDLKSIVEDYLGCIIDCGALPLKPEQVSTLFCNIEDIYEFNSELLEDLERSPDAAAIAECFLERSEAFDIYTLYCMNYPNSVAVLRECMKNQSLVRFFQERQTSLNQSLPLETYLLKPVQRILKYHLLLQELSKHWDKSDPGYETVEDAIVTMTAVAWYINDMKRKQEHAVRLQEIESLLVNWSGPDLSGFGELVLEGSFKVQRVKKERAFFLFDKMLLIAKKRPEHFVYSTHIFCCNLLLVETLKDPMCFRVSDQTIPKQQHVVQTKNQEEKRLWVHYLKMLIAENHPASLPHKARQVLGDTFCQSPQLDDHLKKASDDIPAHHRGRRQSEPPELLMYTPEKSRKSLPLLLEGNLPFRRSRRRSAPAKDIEAAFHPNALKQADSDGELRRADSLGSAGSSSTLASSVVEVEAERSESDPAPRMNPEEEDEEELPPLSPPPTLSMTEEILEFINQSRVRDGLNTIRADTAERVQEQPDEIPSPSNFACPLPLLACPSPTTQPLEASVPDQSSKPEVPEAAERPNEEQPQGEVFNTQGPEEKESDDGQQGSVAAAPTSDPHPFILAEEEKESSREDVSSPDFLNLPVQRRQPPTRRSHLTKRDKKIIEKIRSYYEAAAEAEEEEEEDGLVPPRRGSFSQIPSGLVKDSVSRFDTSEHQDKPESEIPNMGDEQLDDPMNSGPPESLKPASDVPADELTDKHTESRTSTVMQHEGTSDPQSNGEETEIHKNICEKSPVEHQEMSNVKDTEGQRGNSPNPPEQNPNDSKDEAPETGNLVLNEHELHQAEPDRVHREPPETRIKSRVQAGTSENLEGPPSQIKVGRWSRHSRIVTANRILFESMGSDVAGIGLFEASPTADPVLMENSERILSKVQTLAQMYSAKASTMKVPLHHKLAGTVRNQSWLSARPVTQVQARGQKSQSPAKIEPEAEVQSHTMQQTSNQSQTGTSSQNHSQSRTGEGQMVEEALAVIKRAENLMDGFQELVTAPCESRFFGHMLVKQQLTSHHHTDGLVLSRPRDFMSTLTAGREPSWGENHHSPSERTEHPNRPSVNGTTDQTSSDTTTPVSFGTHGEEWNIGWCCSSRNVPILSAVTVNRGTTGDQIPKGHSTEGTLETERWEEPDVENFLSEDVISESQSESSVSGDQLQRKVSKDGDKEDKGNKGDKEDGSRPDAECLRPQSIPSPENTDDPGRWFCSEILRISTPPQQIQTDLSDPGTPPHPVQTPHPHRLPTFTSRRPSDLRPLGEPAPPDCWTVVCSEQNEPRELDEPIQNISSLASGPDASSALATTSAFKPPRAPPIYSPLPPPSPSCMVRNPPCPSPLRVIPASSPVSGSPVTALQPLSCLSPPPPRPPQAGRMSSGRSPSSWTGPPSCPAPSPSLHSPAGPTPVTSSSVFTRSLAASCISQSISQSMSKNKQQAPPTNVLTHSLPSTLLRRCSPSPKPQQGSAVMANGSTKDLPLFALRSSPSPLQCAPPPLSQRSPSPLQSAPPPSSQRSLSPLQPAPPPLCHRSPSPFTSLSVHQHPPTTSPSPRLSFLHSRLEPSQNTNNNNSAGFPSGWNGTSTNRGWSLSPQKTSMTNGDVKPQSPDSLWPGSHNRVARPFSASEPNSRVQSPSPSFTHLCSPPPRHDCSSHMANKPPHPHSSRAGGSGCRNPLGLTVEVPGTPSSPFGHSSSSSLSPPPIGISTNVWTNSVTAPQPRNPRYPPWSSSALGLHPSFVPRSSSRASSPSGPCSLPAQSLRRSLSSSLADCSSSPAMSSTGQRHSWVDGGPRRSLQRLDPSHSPSCLGSQTPLGSAIGGQHFTSAPWPNLQELSCNYSPTPNPTPPVEWGDSEPGEGSCRSQLICAYIARPSREPTLSARPALSSPFLHHNFQPHPPTPAAPPTPLPPGKQGSQKASYATTVNLQIAGSGRIASFSTAQVSLTQTLQGGGGGPAAARRVSINGLFARSPEL